MWLTVILAPFFLFCSCCWNDKLRGAGGADLGAAAILEFQPESDKDENMASAITSLEADSHFLQSFHFLQMQR